MVEWGIDHIAIHENFGPPADNPQVAIAVVIENGGGQGQSAFGNQIAAPIAKRVLEAVLSR